MVASLSQPQCVKVCFLLIMLKITIDAPTLIYNIRLKIRNILTKIPFGMGLYVYILYIYITNANLYRKVVVALLYSLDSNKIWRLCLVPTSTTRFASDVGYRMATTWIGSYKDFLWTMTSDSLTENAEYDIPHKFWRPFLDCMPQ